MEAESFLSSIVEVAIGIAGFSGIVAAIRQRDVSSWPHAQRIMFQILFFASAAAIVFSLLPAVLLEAGFTGQRVWSICGVLLVGWFVFATAFRVAQSRAAAVDLPIPRPMLAFAVVASLLQIYNLFGGGSAWPYMIGVLALIANGFSMFLLLLLGPGTDVGEE